MKSGTLSKIALLAIGLVTSSVSHSAVISVDWQSAGDNLISRDTSSGLDWLDLTQTTDYSYYTVLSKLSSEGALNGWRFATNAEVVSLWSNFNIDLSASAPVSSPGFDSRIFDAASMLGNLACTYTCNSATYGTLGLTADAYSAAVNARNIMGALAYESAGTSTNLSLYFSDGLYAMSDFNSSAHIGSYLVQTSPVPVPGALWLFGAGLIGLSGIARRKNRS